MNFAIDICDGKSDCPDEDEFCKYLFKVIVSSPNFANVQHIQVFSHLDVVLFSFLKVMRALVFMLGTEPSRIILDH